MNGNGHGFDSEVARFERKRTFDLALLLSVTAGYVVMLLAWFLNILSFSISRLAVASLVVTAVYMLLTWLLDRATHLPKFVWLEAAVQAGGILALAGIWHYAGGITNPAFLAVPSVPVAIAAVIHRPLRAFGLGVTAFIGIVIVAIAEVPELGWYFSPFGLPRMLTGDGGSIETVNPFGGAPPTPAESFVTLVTCLIVGTLGIALVSTAVRRSLAGRVLRETTSEQGFLRDTPAAVAVVDPVTGRLLAASEVFRVRLLLDPGFEGSLVEQAVRLRDGTVRDLLPHGGDIYGNLVLGAEERPVRVSGRETKFAELDVVLVAVEDVPVGSIGDR